MNGSHGDDLYPIIQAGEVMILLPVLTRSLRYRLSRSLWLRRWIIPLRRAHEVMRCYLEQDTTLKELISHPQLVFIGVGN